jgi:flagellum-specific ATP synthase
MPGCNSEYENQIVSRARQLLATYEDMAELIRLGAYRLGTDPKVDEAIHYFPLIEEFLKQRKTECTRLADGYAELARRLDLAPAQQEVPDAGGQPAANPQGATVMERNRLRPQVNSRSTVTNAGNDLNAAKRALRRDQQ